MMLRPMIGVVLGLLASCRSERAAFRMPAAAPIVAAPLPVAPPADAKAASAVKPALPLPAPDPAASPPIQAAGPDQYKPAHWPLRELARKNKSKVAAAPNEQSSPPPSSAPTSREKGISNTVYLVGGDVLAIAGIVIGLIIGGGTGLIVGLVFFVPGYLFLLRAWTGSWKLK